MGKRRNFTKGIPKLHKYNEDLASIASHKPSEYSNPFESHIKEHNDFFSEGPKAHSMEEASQNPQRFLSLMKTMNIKKLKGVAF